MLLPVLTAKTNLVGKPLVLEEVPAVSLAGDRVNDLQIPSKFVEVNYSAITNYEYPSISPIGVTFAMRGFNANIKLDQTLNEDEIIVESETKFHSTEGLFEINGIMEGYTTDMNSYAPYMKVKKNIIKDREPSSKYGTTIYIPLSLYDDLLLTAQFMSSIAIVSPATDYAVTFYSDTEEIVLVSGDSDETVSFVDKVNGQIYTAAGKAYNPFSIYDKQYCFSNAFIKKVISNRNYRTFLVNNKAEIKELQKIARSNNIKIYEKISNLLAHNNSIRARGYLVVALNYTMYTLVYFLLLYELRKLKLNKSEEIAPRLVKSRLHLATIMSSVILVICAAILFILGAFMAGLISLAPLVLINSVYYLFDRLKKVKENVHI